MKVQMSRGSRIYGTWKGVEYEFPDNWSEAETKMLVYYALRMIAGDANAGHREGWLPQRDIDKALQRFFLTRREHER